MLTLENFKIGRVVVRSVDFEKIKRTLIYRGFF